MPNTTVEITVIVQPYVVATVETGYQTSVRKFATVAEMLDTRGRAGDIAYCYNGEDTFWRWSKAQQMWVTANI